MELRTLTLNEVRHVRRIEGSRTAPCTVCEILPAEGGSEVITLPGHPPLADGMRVTVLLEKPGDWRSLAGWRDWTHDTVAPPAAGTSRLIARLTTALAPFWLALAAFEDRPGQAAMPLLLALACAVMAARYGRRARLEERAGEILAELQEPPPAIVTRE